MVKQTTSSSVRTQIYDGDVAELGEIDAEYGQPDKGCRIVRETGPALARSRRDKLRTGAAQPKTGPSTRDHAPSADLPAARPVSREWELAVRFAIIAGFIFIFYSSITGRVFQPVIRSLVNLQWSLLIVRPSVLWAAMGILLLTFRTFMWFRYRPFAPADMTEAPFLTVIIPAYNEEKRLPWTLAELTSFLDAAG